MYVGEYVVACSFRNFAYDCTWAFIGIYAPNIDSHKRSLWEELAGLLSWWDLPWCIKGDFNVSYSLAKDQGKLAFVP